MKNNYYLTNIFLGFPDPFVKVSVDGSGQVYTTEPSKATVYPKWNTHYDLFLGQGDGITISVWNHRKIHKKQGGGFLGCVRISAATIQRLKDIGCEYLFEYVKTKKRKLILVNIFFQTSIWT